jgi:hypothetical protein
MMLGYEYWLMGESSSVIQWYQCVPSSLIASDNGVRGPLFVPGRVAKLLHIITWRTFFSSFDTFIGSLSVTASMPD